MRTALLIAAASLTVGVSAPPAMAASPDHMLDVCRAYAAQHLHISADIINVKYEGQRTDRTHAVNGDSETNPPVTFQCSFNAAGTKVVHWVRNAPAGCPSDVSQADRYKYPACK
jgi:hypothetical protein